MQQYIARRLILMVPTFIGVSMFIFVVMRIMPGDIALLHLSGEMGGGVSEKALADLRHQLGIDRPIYEQYAVWMAGILRLDFGRSMWTKKPVIEEIVKRLPITMELAILAIVISILIAVPVGVLSAIYQDTWVDYVFRVVSITGIAMPSFWTGTLIVLFLVLWFNWSPPLGYTHIWQDPMKNFQILVWPVVAIGYYMSAVVSRMTRSCMLEVLREDYIRTARAKGLRERLVISRHALKNALLPVITISGIQFGHLLGGTVLMEIIFSIPGMGRNLVDAIFNHDYTLVQGIVLLLATMFMFLNLIVDLFYGWLDPRIRYG